MNCRLEGTSIASPNPSPGSTRLRPARPRLSDIRLLSSRSPKASAIAHNLTFLPVESAWAAAPAPRLPQPTSPTLISSEPAAKARADSAAGTANPPNAKEVLKQPRRSTLPLSVDFAAFSGFRPSISCITLSSESRRLRWPQRAIVTDQRLRFLAAFGRGHRDSGTLSWGRSKLHLV